MRLTLRNSLTLRFVLLSSFVRSVFFQRLSKFLDALELLELRCVWICRLRLGAAGFLVLSLEKLRAYLCFCSFPISLVDLSLKASLPALLRVIFRGRFCLTWLSNGRRLRCSLGGRIPACGWRYWCFWCDGYWSR